MPDRPRETRTARPETADARPPAGTTIPTTERAPDALTSRTAASQLAPLMREDPGTGPVPVVPDHMNLTVPALTLRVGGPTLT